LPFKSNDPTLPDGPAPELPADHPRARKRKRRRRALLLLIALIVYLLYAYWADEYGITVSPETTYLTGPLRPDGTVDYFRALQERLSEGITPENNAAPLLLRAFGPRGVPEDARDDILAQLGLPSLPEDGRYFTNLWDYADSLPSAERAALLGGSSVIDEYDWLVVKARGGPWSAERHPLLARWLAANDLALALVVQASQRPHSRFPLIESKQSPWRTGLSFSTVHGKLHDAVRALTARAQLRLSGDDWRGALQDVLACHRLARVLAQEGLLEVVTATALEALVCQTDIGMVTSGRLSPDELRALLFELQQLRPMRRPADALMATSRLAGLAFTTALARGYDIDAFFPQPVMSANGEFDVVFSPSHQGDVRYPLQWDVILRMQNEHYNRLIKAMNLARFSDSLAACEQIEQEVAPEEQAPTGLFRMLSELINWLNSLRGVSASPAPGKTGLGKDIERFKAAARLSRWGGRPLRGYASRQAGRVLLRMAGVQGSGRLRALHEWAAMYGELTRLAIALELYKHDEGQYPDRLAAVALTYVKAVPLDRFVDKPLEYRRVGKGYLLYSVGLNQIDDGGINADDDIVVQVK